MATSLQLVRNDGGQSYLMADLDLKDNRYPSLSPKSRPHLGHNPSSFSADMERRLSPSDNNNSQLNRRSFDPTAMVNGEQRQQHKRRSPSGARTPDGSPQPSQDPSRSSLSYMLPENAPRRVVERYSLDENGAPVNGQLDPNRNSSLDTPTRSNTPQPARPNGTLDNNGGSLFANSNNNTPRHPDVVLASSPSAGSNSNGFPPIMPLSASPNYQPPVSSRNRTYPQQPTYVNSQPPNAVDAVYTPMPPPQEEVCLECAMRDQDMADVDVTSPGIWDRASDVLYEDLKEREKEDTEKGVSPDPNRPRAVGGRLTEQNLKIWLSINPREPASRQQTLNTYVKAQRAMLEAEALAHTQAMQEAKRLDSRMRDTYSQLRRSAYELGSTPTPTDDSGAVRIKPPISPVGQNYSHSHNRSQSRDVALLENGMIVETVDVRREEREARERRRKEEKRARKSSRSSVFDATSIMSGTSGGQPFSDTLRPHPVHSSATLPRPNSVFTNAGHERPDIPRAYSQASFSDVHSLGSTSPRRKFFGMRNLSTGWRSQDSLTAPSYAPSGMSGSMMDMHVALQREDRRKTLLSPNDGGASRRSVAWPVEDQPQDPAIVAAEEKAKKKKSGLIKWWRAVTRSNKPDVPYPRESVYEKDDGLPLTPPPPLSYLVGRGSPEVHINNRTISAPATPAANAVYAQNMNTSPQTGPSSGLPSPTSTRPPPNGFESDLTMVNYDDGAKKSNEWRLHPTVSEPDLRGRVMNQGPVPPVPSLPAGARRSIAMAQREKSLPPLPTDESPALPSPGDRPHTVYTYDPRAMPPGTQRPHDFLPPPTFQHDVRRQSFGGMTSKPNLAIHTVPDPRQSLSPQYDEFGYSRRSLGFLGDDSHRRATSPIPSSTTKRKSKFGFASLLGGKNKNKEVENNYLTFTSEPLQVPHGQPFPTMGANFRYEESAHHSVTGSVQATGSSGDHQQQQRPMRTSMLGRKPLNELVAQDAEFVAYRYPSTDQRLDLAR